jgi:hypothetical protein
MANEEVPEPTDWDKVDAMPMEVRSRFIEKLDHAIELSEKKIELLRQLRANMLVRWSGRWQEGTQDADRAKAHGGVAWLWQRLISQEFKKIQEWREGSRVEVAVRECECRDCHEQWVSNRVLEPGCTQNASEEWVEQCIRCNSHNVAVGPQRVETRRR